MTTTADPVHDVAIRNVSKVFGDVVAVDDFSLDLTAGEIVTFLGPSGCGKTTMLRCVSGLESVTSGEIFIRDQLVSSARVNVPPHRRQVGLVFQSYALWPHMSVARNIQYGLSVLKRPAEEVERRTTEILGVVGLGGLENRLPSELSGGQQQRVALARSLVVRPQVLLLDEPLSNLDAALRDRMRKELRTILKQVGITSIYVTHDQREALAIADRVVLMNHGRIVQQGAPEDLYRNPASVFAATFLGGTNVVHVDEAVPTASGVVGRARSLGTIHGRAVGGDHSIGKDATFRPEHVLLLPANADAGTNRWYGTVAERTYEGWLVEYVVQVNEQRLRVVSPESGFAVDDPVCLSVSEKNVVFLG